MMDIAMLLPTCFGCFTSKASAHLTGKNLEQEGVNNTPAIVLLLMSLPS
jgi:hypothetical protein